MKKTLPSVAVFFCLLTGFLSCSKDSQDWSTAAFAPDRVIMATVSPGETYSYPAGSGTLDIRNQAAHYRLSELVVDKNGAVVYQYIPAAGFKGSDQVTLMQTLTTTEYNNASCSGNSSHNRTTTSLITIKLDVNN